jgi:small redox-active disulfide protein 2
LKIEIMGGGCAKCHRQAQNVEKALAELEMGAEVVKVEDLTEIMNRGVMLTPAVAIDGELVSSGRVASVDELKRLLSSR